MGVSQGWVWLSGRSWGKFLLLATEWGIKEQSLYGIEGWSLFRGCFTTRVYVAAIRTCVSGRYMAAGCSSEVVVKRGSTVAL